MLKFRASRFSLVEDVEVERESETYVWIQGRRRKKVSQHEPYFDTYEEAESFLLKEGQDKINQARMRLETARANHFRMVDKLKALRVKRLAQTTETTEIKEIK